MLAPNPTAEAARLAVVTALTNRSTALFEADRRLKLKPMLKAAAVSYRLNVLPVRGGAP
jgi:hypothetical protein